MMPNPFHPWKRALALLLVTGLLLAACGPLIGPETSGDSGGGTGAVTAPPAGTANPEWDKPFGRPQYFIHVKGHGTISGYVEDDYYFLYHTAPRDDGRLEVPDGSGGTYTLNCDYHSGSYNTPREVCNAEAGRAGDTVLRAWNSHILWTCAEVLAIPPANGGGGGGGGGSGGGSPTAGPTQGPLTAWLECGDHIQIFPEESSQICGIYVQGWESNTSARVEVVYPTMTDPSWGSLPGGIVASPGNTSADPGNMGGTGVDPSASTYYFSEMYSARAGTQPARYVIPIVVRQGSRSVNLSLSVTVVVQGSGACPVGRTADMSYLGWDDRVGTRQEGADGVRDANFGVSVRTGDQASYISFVWAELISADGQVVGVWNTAPGNDQWFLGVYLMNGQLLDPAPGGIHAAPDDFMIYAQDNGRLVAGNTFRVAVFFNDDASCYAATEIKLR